MAVEQDDVDLMDASSGKAAFHGGALLIYRFHVLLSEINDLSARGDFINWKRKLDTLYRELVWTLKENEMKERDKIVKEKVVPALTVLSKINRTTAPQARRLAQDHAYVEVMEYEIYLRQLQGKYGLVMPKTSDPRYAFRTGT